MEIQRTIKYEAELDRQFAYEIAQSPGAETLFECIQCGACSAACPVSIYMDLTPRRVIAMTREGFKHEVLSSLTIWLCSSCYACTVECPVGIKVTDVMYALKQRAIKEGYGPRKVLTRLLAQSFFQAVKEDGRATERKVMLRLYRRAGLDHLIRMAPLGLKLWRTGRLSAFGTERIKNPAEVRTLLECLEEQEGGKSP